MSTVTGIHLLGACETPCLTMQPQAACLQDFRTFLLLQGIQQKQQQAPGESTAAEGFPIHGEMLLHHLMVQACCLSHEMLPAPPIWWASLHTLHYWKRRNARPGQTSASTGSPGGWGRCNCCLFGTFTSSRGPQRRSSEASKEVVRIGPKEEW